MDKNKIKDTLNLPKTRFPMKANLAKNEPGIVEFWDEENVYGQIRENKNGREKFILHDGPPYANGHIHIGTALNKVLKDFIVKYKNISGYDSPYVPGWDCHGLPIEKLVEKKLQKSDKEHSKLEIRNKCYEYAMSHVDIQRDEFKRLGVLGRWEDPYLTLNPVYEATILRVLGKAVEQGYVYRQKKPIHWCMSCTTALAEAELEYYDIPSDSIFVRFPLKKACETSPLAEYQEKADISFLIWTTTPWTLPANLALALHPDLDYGLYRINDGKDMIIIAKDLREKIEDSVDTGKLELVKEFKGREIEGDISEHPFIDRDSRVVLANYVVLEQGTGIVHTAPGHGQEDYMTGRKYSIETFCPVDENGRFTSEYKIHEGISVFKANPLIIKLLEEKGMLVHSDTFSHSYPHCWRCKKPVIFRATEQWFIDIDHKGLRERALESIKNVKWIPGWSINRIYSMIENRPDWCISRQRSWGIPIIAIRCRDCNEVIIDDQIIYRFADIVEKKGIGIYFEKNIREILPDISCKKCQSDNIVQEEDILDVWFESGVSHKAVLSNNDELSWPSDVYIEGSDQHRGWFNSSLILSLISEGEPPYRQVITHGFVNDEHGKKMSKSLGNFISHEDIISKYGGDILRIWVASEDYREDIRVSHNIIQNLAEGYRKIRNTFRFALSNLFDFDPNKDLIKIEEMQDLDKFYYGKFIKLVNRIKEAYEKYNFHTVVQNLVNFVSIDLSSQYHDIIKDRLYVSRKDSLERRSSQSCMYRIVKGLLTISSPILSFTTDEAWQFLPRKNGDPVSVHLTEIEDCSYACEKESLYEDILKIRSIIQKSLENLRKDNIIGLSLDSSVSVAVPKRIYSELVEMIEDLKDIFLVSELNITEFDGKETENMEDSIEIDAYKHKGRKCLRCWRYYHIEEDICPRCSKVIDSIS